MNVADVAECYEKHANALLRFAASQVGASNADEVLSVAVLGVLHQGGRGGSKTCGPICIGPWRTHSEGIGPDPLSTALTVDGVVVCEVGGILHHVTERTDGSFVAVVRGDSSAVSPQSGEPVEVPREAVDCQTGERSPIESVFSSGGDGQFWFTETVGDRVFRGVGDAEGNADLFNESDVSINGDDYAGGHVFSAEGSLVTYGDFGQSAGPHFTTRIRTRETTSGELLWSQELSNPFSFLSYFGDRVLAELSDPESLPDGAPATNRAAVFDAATGERLGDWPAPFRLLYVGSASPESILAGTTTMTLTHEPTDVVPAGERWFVRAGGTCVVDGDVKAGTESSATGGSLEETVQEPSPCASITVAVILGPGEGKVISSTASEELITRPACLPSMPANPSSTTSTTATQTGPWFGCQPKATSSPEEVPDHCCGLSGRRW